MAIFTKRTTMSLIVALTLITGLVVWGISGVASRVQQDLGLVVLQAKAPQYFTPDLPGLQPAVRFVVNGLRPEDQTNCTWNLKITDSAGKILHQASGQHIIDSGIVWDGRDSKSTLIAAGKRCNVALDVTIPGKGLKQLTGQFPLGLALIQKNNSVAVSNISIEFSYRNTDSGRDFFLNESDFARLDPFVAAMETRPDLNVSVWAGKDRSIRNLDLANTQALQRAAKIRRKLIQLGLSPERIQINVIPPTPGHLRDFDIELTIDKPLLQVLSSVDQRS